MIGPADNEAEMAEPIKVFTAEHCRPCHEMVKLLKGKRVASNVVAPVDLIDIETEEGFKSINDNELPAVPCAKYKGKTCKLEVDEEAGVLLITCDTEEEESPIRAEPSEEEDNPI